MSQLSEQDILSMDEATLHSELAARGLSQQGPVPELQSRLIEAINYPPPPPGSLPPPPPGQPEGVSSSHADDRENHDDRSRSSRRDRDDDRDSRYSSRRRSRSRSRERSYRRRRSRSRSPRRERSSHRERDSRSYRDDRDRDRSGRHRDDDRDRGRGGRDRGRRDEDRGRRDEDRARRDDDGGDRGGGGGGGGGFRPERNPRRVRCARDTPSTSWDVPAPGYGHLTPMQYKELMAAGALPPPIVGAGGAVDAMMSMNSHMTRQARRLYVGNIPPTTNELDLKAFFNDQMRAAALAKDQEDSVLGCQVNLDKLFAFLEFRTVDETSAAMGLDGVVYQNNPLKLRRPKDYQAVHSDGSRIIQSDRIMISGFPADLVDDQIKELLTQFGPLKSFSMIGDDQELNSCYCEYEDGSLTEQVIEALNGMAVGESELKVVKAPVTIGQAGAAPAIKATRVLALLNMVTPEELMDNDEYEDILEDIKEECGKFGAVSSVKIPRPTSLDNLDAVPGVGKIYVEFSSTEGSETAEKALSGRKFANRMVFTAFYPEDKYATNDFQ